ncbi:MAG TPA: DNA-binding domain-containing protein, partial [Magnetospirillaceae bacterium]|nr:DNA-binding domain-containing protein [Magnetospirillaceae bacterium]
MTLARLQQDFCAYLLDRPNRIETEVAGDLEVYHHAYRAQLLNCLRDTFEKSWSWLGDEAFEAAARAHIEAHPPHAWTLNVYGEGFDRTLAEHHPEDPEIAELAWLEWALRRAFDGPDADSVDPAVLATIDWENAVLHLVPTVRLGSVITNCAALWSALAEDETPPPAQRLPGPAAIRVWRKGLSAKYRSIDAVEERALRLVLGGADFAQLCAVLAAELGDERGTAEIGRILGIWLQDGL